VIYQQPAVQVFEPAPLAGFDDLSWKLPLVLAGIGGVTGAAAAHLSDGDYRKGSVAGAITSGLSMWLGGQLLVNSGLNQTTVSVIVWSTIAAGGIAGAYLSGGDNPLKGAAIAVASVVALSMFGRSSS